MIMKFGAGRHQAHKHERLMIHLPTCADDEPQADKRLGDDEEVHQECCGEEADEA